MTRKTAKEATKPAGVASADLEENGVPVSEKGAENLDTASSKHRGEMAAPTDANAKPTSAAGRASNGASVSNEVAESRDSRLDRLERSLDKVITFLSEVQIDDESDPNNRPGEGQDGDCQDGGALADPPREGADATEDGELVEPPPKKTQTKHAVCWYREGPQAWGIAGPIAEWGLGNDGAQVRARKTIWGSSQAATR